MYYGKPFKMFSPTSQGVCKRCDKQEWVDTNGKCETCVRVTAEVSFRTADMCKPCEKEHNLYCIECHKKTELYVEGTMMCPKCAAKEYTVVNCHGCGLPFAPKNRHGSFCNTCFLKIKSGKCVDCSKIVNPKVDSIDNTGRCESCSNKK